ncbi:MULTISPECIES: hypothetical protein [unclassified Lentimicrobium]|uniref:hypothetical protein n=1 Tax=unclassified Lentimicrobium TaxID=2677434 RepID=UPI001556E322|nr:MULTISPECIES: hypothetical protein [unclassified Lentimicrobium]NPD45560.1 hypothetical protein [Lentimicrobium sp. S6]NPD83639.1 hypothetical protein [Lentimicrobium sp. L6]
MFKKRIKIYLHIGQPKTGSSAIQSFLNTNRKHLFNKHSILYPNLNSNDYSNGNQHNHAPYFMNTFVKHADKECIELFSDIKRYCQKNRIKKIVISNEGFFWHWWSGLMKDIIEKLGFDLSIILYLRRQDKYLESAWKQWGHKLPECNNIQDYYETLNLDWLDNLNMWLDKFEPSEFQVFPYEKSTIGEDVVEHFLGVLGVKRDTEFQNPPFSNENFNIGFDRDTIELLRLSKELVKDQHDHSYLDLMHDIINEKQRKNNTSTKGFLSPLESIAIINKYTQSNNRIAELFLDNSNTLFNDSLPSETDAWEPYSGLNLELVIPLLMEKLKLQSDEIKKLKRELISIKSAKN